MEPVDTRCFARCSEHTIRHAGTFKDCHGATFELPELGSRAFEAALAHPDVERIVAGEVVVLGRPGQAEFTAHTQVEKGAGLL